MASKRPPSGQSRARRFPSRVPRSGDVKLRRSSAQISPSGGTATAAQGGRRVDGGRPQRVIAAATAKPMMRGGLDCRGEALQVLAESFSAASAGTRDVAHDRAWHNRDCDRIQAQDDMPLVPQSRPLSAASSRRRWVRKGEIVVRGMGLVRTAIEHLRSGHAAASRLTPNPQPCFGFLRQLSAASG